MVTLRRMAMLSVCLVGCSSTASSSPAAPGGPPPPAGDAAVDAPGGPTVDGSTPMSPDATTHDAAGNKDAAAGDSGSPPPDSAMTADTQPAGCGEFTGDTNYTCSMDGNSRGECIGGSPMIEQCARGCLREPAGQDSICLGTTDNWSCNGSYGTDRALDGDYYLTSFGCWVDPSNTIHTDPGDNCIPSCLNQAIAAGVCNASDDGPTCEERLNWFTADGARFGCLQRMRVTNPATGHSVIAIALDFGPACSVEATVSKAVFDASGRVNLELFGGDRGVSDMALVHVVEVDNSTPLGPVP
jgi:hypothetical protein